MTVDTRYGHLIDSKGNKYQVLQPVKYADVHLIDESGNDVVTKVELPREWDEAATYAAMALGNAK